MMTVMWFPQTGATRVFPSFNLAQEWYPNHPPCTNPMQLLDIKDHKTTLTAHQVYERMYRRIGHKSKRPYNPSLSTEAVLDEVWALAREAGDTITRAPRQSESPLRRGFLINLKACVPIPGAPKQVNAIIGRLAAERHDFYSKDEMIRFMNSFETLRAINTRQDPWRIFRYYRPILIQHNVIQDNSDAA